MTPLEEIRDEIRGLRRELRLRIHQGARDAAIMALIIVGGLWFIAQMILAMAQGAGAR